MLLTVFLLKSEFEAKKALFKAWERDFATLFRRAQQYFKDQQANVRNWEKVSETVHSLYPPESPWPVVEELGRTTEEALKSYEAAWAQVREMMIKYEAECKNMARKITDRDNARVDFDRARTKAEKNPADTVLEATARASEHVYQDKNFQATQSLDYFLDTRLDNLSAILSVLSRATVTLYSCCSDFPPFDMVVAPAPELATTAGVPMSVAPKSPRPRLGTPEAQPQQQPQLSRGSAAPAVKSPRAAQLAAEPVRERSASHGGTPSATKTSPYAAKKPVAAVDKPPAKSLPPLEKKQPAAPARTPVATKPKRRVVALYDFTPAADDSEGLAVRADEELEVTEQSEDGEWLMCVNSQGYSGFVPLNYTEPSYRPV